MDHPSPGSRLDADHPENGVLIPCRITLGYVEGQNLAVERYSGRSNYTPDLARKAVASNPEVIFAVGNRAAPDLLGVTQTIPVVRILAFALLPDLVANLARPGGNLTGVSIEAGAGVFGKHLECCGSYSRT